MQSLANRRTKWKFRCSDPRKALPNRAAQNWGSGVTGSRVAAPQHAGEAKLSYNRSLSKSAREFELKLRTPGEASTGSEASGGNLWILSLRKKRWTSSDRESGRCGQPVATLGRKQVVESKRLVPEARMLGHRDLTGAVENRYTAGACFKAPRTAESSWQFGGGGR